jgi:hypothetical protein
MSRELEAWGYKAFAIACGLFIVLYAILYG